MKKYIAALTLAAAFLAPSQAAVVYTSATTFLPQVNAGAYTETFSFQNFDGDTDLAFSNGQYSYTAHSDFGLYASGDFLGTYFSNEDLTITFTGATVTALGGNFYNTSSSDAFQNITISVSLSDGTVVSFAPSSVATSYRGFTSDIGITSLTLSNNSNTSFVSLDNLTVGTRVAATPPTGDVPEPASLALTGLGLAGLLALRRRRA